MACTIIRLVQAAVNLRRKFECAIQSSFDSMDGDVLDDEEENETETNTESVSDKETKLSNEENDESRLKENIEFSKNIDVENSQLNEDEMAIDNKSKKISSFPNFRFPFSSNNSIFDSQPPKISNIVIYHPFTKVPSINALDSDVLESTTSETDSDTISSIKSVRFRSRDAHSPSSGCKPPKLSRGENVTSMDIMNVTKTSGTWSQSIETKETTTSTVHPIKDKIVGREERKSSSSSGSESCSSGKDENSRRQWLSYSKWILKGQRSMEEEECQEKENRCEPHGTYREIKTEKENEEILKSMDEYDVDTDDDIELNQDIFIDDKEIEEEEEIEESDDFNSDEMVDEELIWLDSMDEGYVDDYMSFEQDRYEQQGDVIYEEEEAQETQETEIEPKSQVISEKSEKITNKSLETETGNKDKLQLENTEPLSSSPEDRENRESIRQSGYRHGSDHLPDIPENNLNRSRRERGSKKRLPSIKIKPDLQDSGCHREDSRKTKDGFEDEFGDDLTPSDYDTSQIEVTSPSIVRWSNSQRRSSKGSLKRSFRPHLVQRQRCIQLEEGRSSDDSSDEEKVVFDCYSNSSSPRSRARSHSSRGDSFSKDVVLEIDSPQHSQGEKSLRELPLVVVAGPQGGTYVKPLSRNYRSHSSLRVPSPAKSSKKTQRSGGSLDANLGPSNLVSFIGSRKSFEYERRLPPSPCDSLTVPHHPSMDPSLREQRRELPLRKYSYSPRSSQHSFRDSVHREFRRSQSERVSGSPSVDTPVRSESVRVSRGRNVSSYSPNLRSPRSPHFSGRELFLGNRSPTKRDEDIPGNEHYRIL